MLARLQHLLDFHLEGAVHLSTILGILEKLPPTHALEKPRAGLEVIIRAIPLIGARFPGRRRDRKAEPVRILLPHRFRDRRLAASRRRGQDDYSRDHSRFSSCSRNFSRSPFIAITVWVMRASFALEPIVFTSRSSSCARNPSCFPTA